jgi:predicted DNA-binding transcriptional regulator AlpA
MAPNVGLPQGMIAMKDSKRKSLTVTVPEAGEMLGISRNAAYDCAARGDLPTIRLGKRLVVPRAARERMRNGNAPKAA